MAGAVRRAVLGHLRVPLGAQSGLSFSLHGGSDTKLSSPLYVRFMSSHDDHITKDEIVQRVLAVIKDFPKVDPSKVTPDVHFQKDLGLDSLDNVELVIALEEEFKLEIPELEADKIDSTKLAIEYIYNHPMSS